MTDKQINTEKTGLFKRMLFLFIRQIIASLLCLSVALLMKYSKADVLNTCANALKLAINHNPGWEETVKDAFSDLRNNFPETDIK